MTSYKIQYDYFNCGRSFSGRKGVNLHHLINLICTTFQLPKMSWKLVSEPHKVKRRLNNCQERRFFQKPIFWSVDAKKIKKPKFWPNLVILEFSKLLSGLYMLWLPGYQISTKKIHAVKNNSKKSTFSKIFYKSRNYGDFWLVTLILASFWWVPSVYRVSLPYEIGKCLKTSVRR